MANFRPGPRLLAALVLALVALVGVLAGVALERSVLARPALSAPRLAGSRDALPGEPRSGAMPMRRRFYEEMARELTLTPAQRTQIDSILDAQQLRVRELQRELRPRFREITRETRTAIDAVLTPEQRARLRELQREGRMRRGRADTPFHGGPAPR